jgi:hypothetical protein
VRPCHSTKMMCSISARGMEKMSLYEANYAVELYCSSEKMREGTSSTIASDEALKR